MTHPHPCHHPPSQHPRHHLTDPHLSSDHPDKPCHHPTMIHLPDAAAGELRFWRQACSRPLQLETTCMNM